MFANPDLVRLYQLATVIRELFLDGSGRRGAKPAARIIPRAG